ncbi:aminoglycoside phosphotransferase family protein [Nocardiopsis terrae]
MRTPPAEVTPTPALVRRLLREQHPDLAELPVAPLANGWDNVLFGLGEHLCVRMPRRTAAARLVLNEQRWLPGVAERVGFPVPVPLRTGRPGHGYPWHWSVNPWFGGRAAAEVPPADRGPLVEPLALFLSRLHVPAPRDAPENPVRGVPLRRRDGRVRERLAGLDPPHAAPLLAQWEALVDTPGWSGPPLWLHGDLHPANILVGDGPNGRADLAAVIDFGDLTSGDPATDLALAWMLFEAGDRARLRARLDRLSGIDGDTWKRARAWAVSFASVLATSTDDHPVLAAVGEHTIGQLLAEG